MCCILYLVIRRKTIYEYHRIDMKKEEIANHTAIYFTALTSKNAIYLFILLVLLFYLEIKKIIVDFCDNYSQIQTIYFLAYLQIYF